MTHEPQKLWVEQLETALELTENIPLWGTPPPFPWETFSSALGDFFGISPFQLSHYSTKWQEAPSLSEGFGKNPILQHFTLTPLPIHLTWVMSKEHQEQLVSMLLTDDGKKFTDSTLSEGFFQFIFLKAMETFNHMNVYGNLSTTLIDNTLWKEEGAFCIDVKMILKEHTLYGRLVVPSSAYHSFKTHFSLEKPPIISDAAFAATPLSLQVHIGNTKMFPSELENVRKGDFILLDRCSYDPTIRKGTATLVLGNTALFDLRIKEDEIKILEYAFYQEDMSMNEEDFSESKPPFGEEQNPSNSNNEEEEPLWEPHEGEEKPFSSIQKIPMNLTVEVGRVKMPLEKLTQLKPGNVLHLPLAADHNVYLSVEGKRIAQGELVKIGDALGVKILKVGE